MKETHHKSINPLYFEVAPDVWGMKDVFVNNYMIRNAADNSWVLVDTGYNKSPSKIKRMAAELFEGKPPAAILLTHGHFDHVGSVATLAEEWEVPVYAHWLELPYLIGKAAYPPADPTVGGGLITRLSCYFPNKPINIEKYVSVLPDDGVVPFLNDWKYIHTPGHAPGHISLFREWDRVLIAGDAFTTTQQESAISVLLQSEKLSGPPAYFTYDWEQAYDSVEKLVLLQPDTVATGHGKPLRGYEMRQALNNLYINFGEETIPVTGRYVNDPAVADASGMMYVPPVRRERRINWVAVGSAVLISAAVLILITNRKKKNLFSW